MKIQYLFFKYNKYHKKFCLTMINKISYCYILNYKCNALTNNKTALLGEFIGAKCIFILSISYG